MLKSQGCKSASDHDDLDPAGRTALWSKAETRQRLYYIKTVLSLYINFLLFLIYFQNRDSCSKQAAEVEKNDNFVLVKEMRGLCVFPLCQSHTNGKLSDPFTCCLMHPNSTMLPPPCFIVDSISQAMSSTYFLPDAALGVQIKLFSL